MIGTILDTLFSLMNSTFFFSFLVVERINEAVLQNFDDRGRKLKKEENFVRNLIYFCSKIGKKSNDG